MFNCFCVFVLSRPVCFKKENIHELGRIWRPINNESAVEKFKAMHVEGEMAHPRNLKDFKGNFELHVWGAFERPWRLIRIPFRTHEWFQIIGVVPWVPWNNEKYLEKYNEKYLEIWFFNLVWYVTLLCLALFTQVSTKFYWNVDITITSSRSTNTQHRYYIFLFKFPEN